MKRSDIEVRCHHCNVTFPAGTRRCLHCGERTGPSEIQLGVTDDLSQLPHLRDTPIPGPISPDDIEDETEAVTRKGPGRIVLGSIWLLVAVGGSIYRACNPAG